LDRFHITNYCFNKAIEKAGTKDFELLVLDNNSSDYRTSTAKYINSDLIPSDKIFTVFDNQKNNGIAGGYNQLIKKAKGEHICFLPNDIVLSENWLVDLIRYNTDVYKSGLTSIHCEGDRGVYMPLLNERDEFTSVWKNKEGITSGVSLINMNALGAIGKFDETLGVYGREREQFARRLSLLGYYNYYIPNQSSIHLGKEVNEINDYTKMKEKALQIGNARYNTALEEMKKTNNYCL